MITRVKAIADGILMIQSLNERYDRHRDRIGEMDEILDEMRERVDKEDLNQYDNKTITTGDIPEGQMEDVGMLYNAEPNEQKAG